VVATYLFGSASGLCRPDSDLDIALFLTDTDPNSREADHMAGEVALRLAPVGEHPFDVNIVDPDNTIFAFRIISQGIPLVVRDNALMTHYKRP
jgi:predicted nucleotidyltransferase